MLGALLLAMVWLVANVQSNLERQNINSGFGFLTERAGFGINQTLIDYTEDSSFGRVLTVGLLNTLLVSVLGVFFATRLPNRSLPFKVFISKYSSPINLFNHNIFCNITTKRIFK